MNTMTIRNKTLHYIDQGEGFPILFAHSYLWSARVWAPQIEELSKSYRCIAVDMWSHGKSDRLPSVPVTNNDTAEDYWTLMQELGINEFAVVGTSVGGMVVTHLALNHPEAVKAYAIVGSSVGAEPEAKKEKYFGILDGMQAEQRVTEEVADIFVPFFFSDKTKEDKPQLVEDFRKIFLATPAEQIDGMVEVGKGLFSRPDLLDQLPSITVPSLVLVGEKDAPRPPSESKAMADRLPNVEFTILPEIGHVCSLEAPEETTKALQNLLNRI